MKLASTDSPPDAPGAAVPGAPPHNPVPPAGTVPPPAGTAPGITPSNPAPAAPTFQEALRFWALLGCVSFGGPAGQIALMHRELVQRRRWISEGRFAHALNYCMLLPGPEAQQLATYIGWLLHRTAGGVAAGALFILPSLLLLMALSWAYMVWGRTTWMAGVLWGIKPVVAALVLHALVRLARNTLRNPIIGPYSIGLFALSFVAIQFAWFPFPVVLLLAAGVGWWRGRAAMQPSAGVGAQASAAPMGPATAVARVAAAPAAVIDDDTPIPAHAQGGWPRGWRVLAVGLLLWALPLLALIAWQGWDSTLAQMAWFFTQVALVTFGGAYAVLPYVNQAAVTEFGWLTSAQMMDGLALGESTPGPLIMVLTFVGFVGGWTQQVLPATGAWPLWLPMGALVSACVVTWFTFLPSFVFILGGAPLVEATRQRANASAPLAAIGAAVMGGIASLALNFIAQVAWPHGDLGVIQSVDAAALGWALVALALLMRRHWPITRLLALGAVMGLARSLMP